MIELKIGEDDFGISKNVYNYYFEVKNKPL